MKFILLATQRSGTHLMRRYIRSHPKLDIETETTELPKENGVTIMVKDYRQEMNKFPLILLLRRNIFEQTLSHKLMKHTSEYQRHHVDGNEDIDKSTYTFNVYEFKKLFDIIVKQTQDIIDETSDSNRVIFWYEDIIPKTQSGWDAHMPKEQSRKLCEFLSVESRTLIAKSKKVGGYDRITNYKELYESCQE
jgi:hypothetical protein